MGKWWSVGIVIVSVGMGLAIAARSDGATADLQDVGVLDQLAVPRVPAVDRVDGHTTAPQPSTDPIPVPTPTAATAGLALLAAIVLCRAGHRAIGRA